ncbi:hypothetical protein GCM10010988_15990 [Cnuibacter physcomitrellae]|nr:hypothetical protein GCM10010988_15990 [Cnuibacter physcomitrellae]
MRIGDGYGSRAVRVTPAQRSVAAMGSPTARGADATRTKGSASHPTDAADRWDPDAAVTQPDVAAPTRMQRAPGRMRRVPPAQWSVAAPGDVSSPAEGATRTPRTNRAAPHPVTPRRTRGRE